MDKKELLLSGFTFIYRVKHKIGITTHLFLGFETITSLQLVECFHINDLNQRYESLCSASNYQIGKSEGVQIELKQLVKERLA
jgi:hypothetical protein